MTNTASNRSARSITPPQISAINLSEATKTQGNKTPNRYILHAVEGFGKTSLAAQMPKPMFLMSPGETGLLTLMDAGLIGPTPYLEEPPNWLTFLEQLKAIRDQEHDRKTLAIDALGGFERLCHEHVCERDFSGDWGEKGFTSFNKGYEVALADWRQFLDLLDQILLKRHMIIFILAHTKVKPFKNPEGPDFDRYTVDMHDKTWSLTHKWADTVMFGNFETFVKTKRSGEAEELRKGKATNQEQARMLYTQRRAAWDAKNRNGLPTEIDLGDSPQAAFKALMDAMKAAKEANQQPAGGAQ